jgi:hypothetical protein
VFSRTPHHSQLDYSLAHRNCHQLFKDALMRIFIANRGSMKAVRLRDNLVDVRSVWNNAGKKLEPGGLVSN